MSRNAGDLDTLMHFASEVAARAGEVTRARFGRVATEWKADGTEVTEADREAERLIRSLIRERFPDDGIFGEEEAETASQSGRRWIVDPIDGTRSFSSGVPLYGVLLALEQDGEVLLGCCHLPEGGDTLVAARGAGAWFNGSPARVSGCETLRDARVVTSGLEYWRDRSDPEARAGWSRLVETTRFARTWGDCFGHVMVATGRAEIFADPISGAYWDFAPFLPIVAEAGGRLTDFAGAPLGAWSTSLTTSAALHAPALACWKR